MADLHHDDTTLFKVLEALKSTGLTQQEAVDCILAMQSAGILFREYEVA